MILRPPGFVRSGILSPPLDQLLVSRGVATTATNQSLRRTADLPSTTFTFCGWARRRSFSSVYSSLFGIASATSSPSPAIEVAWTSGGQIYGNAYGAGSDSYTPTRNFTNDVPFFWALVGTTNAGTNNVTLYVRGDADSIFESGTFDNPGTFTPAVFTFGNNGWDEGADVEHWNVRAWSRQLSAGELLVESYTEAPRALADLNGWWPLASANGTVVYKDFSGNKRDLTPNNSPSIISRRRRTNQDIGVWRRRVFGPAASGISGTLAEILDDTTLASAGTTTVLGTLASTLAAAVLAASGSPILQGSLAETLDDATLAAAGSVGSPVSGSVAETLDDTILSASGTTTIVGALAETLDDSTLSASGTSAVVGELAETLDDTTLAASGASGSAVSGSLAVTLANTTSAATGTTAILGTLARTLDDASLLSAGTTTVLGALAQTLGDATLNATGTSGTPVAGEVWRFLKVWSSKLGI